MRTCSRCGETCPDECVSIRRQRYRVERAQVAKPVPAGVPFYQWLCPVCIEEFDAWVEEK